MLIGTELNLPTITIPYPDDNLDLNKLKGIGYRLFINPHHELDNVKQEQLLSYLIQQASGNKARLIGSDIEDTIVVLAHYPRTGKLAEVGVWLTEVNLPYFRVLLESKVSFNLRYMPNKLNYELISNLLVSSEEAGFIVINNANVSDEYLGNLYDISFAVGGVKYYILDTDLNNLVTTVEQYLC